MMYDWCLFKSEDRVRQSKHGHTPPISSVESLRHFTWYHLPQRHHLIRSPPPLVRCLQPTMHRLCAAGSAPMPGVTAPRLPPPSEGLLTGVLVRLAAVSELGTTVFSPEGATLLECVEPFGIMSSADDSFAIDSFCFFRDTIRARSASHLSHNSSLIRSLTSTPSSPHDLQVVILSRTYWLIFGSPLIRVGITRAMLPTLKFETHNHLQSEKWYPHKSLIIKVWDLTIYRNSVFHSIRPPDIVCYILVEIVKVVNNVGAVWRDVCNSRACAVTVYHMPVLMNYTVWFIITRLFYKLRGYKR